ncbi:hypothetical protein [Niveispirillum fermenti]|uniref:hypothetical protein n=1 Tax=Niveispirillum fermenti TaxID=1233113 RepID=UPI003A83E25B
MEGQRHRVNQQPPGLVGGLLRVLLPPASRETVLGDLTESSRTPGEFTTQGLRSDRRQAVRQQIARMDMAPA